MKKGKVVLVGTGFVGMSMAYAMLNRGGVNELILIDINKDKTIGEEMDLSHGLPFAPQKMVIKAGDYDECKDAEVRAYRNKYKNYEKYNKKHYGKWI